MANPTPITSYLELMDTQAASLFSTLPAISEDVLWRRPSQDEWSAGENLSHVAVVHRFFRRFNQLTWPFSSLIARVRPRRNSEIAIDDIYDRPEFPHEVGRLWPPKHSLRRPAPLDTLISAIKLEHRLLRIFYEQRDPALLDQAALFWPKIGWINYIQSLRIAVFHDAHHFDEIRRIFSAAPDVPIPGA